MYLRWLPTMLLAGVLVLLTAPDESSSTFLGRDGPLSHIMKFKKRLLLMKIPMKIALLEAIFGHGRRRGDNRDDDDDDILGDLGLDQLFARPLKRDKKNRMRTTKRPRTRPSIPTTTHAPDDLHLDEHEEALAKESKLKPRSATGIKTQNQLFKIIEFLTSDGVFTEPGDDYEEKREDYDWYEDDAESRKDTDSSSTTLAPETPTRGHDELESIKKKLLSSIESKIGLANNFLANSLTENERHLIKLLPKETRVKLVQKLTDVHETETSKGSEVVIESSTLLPSTEVSDKSQINLGDY